MLDAKNTKDSKKKKMSRITAKLLTANGKGKKTIVLPKEIFGVKVNKMLLAQAVYVYRNRQSQGTKKTKTRGEVRGSNRKIYRQKGTGRARHGAIKAPIFVGGGVAHGPKQAGAKPKLSRKIRRSALFGSLTSKFSKKNILFLDYDFTKLPIRTKEMVKLLKNIGFKEDDFSKTLLVLEKKYENVLLAGRNIPGLAITQANLLNVYQVLRYQKMIISISAIPVLKETFIK